MQQAMAPLLYSRLEQYLPFDVVGLDLTKSAIALFAKNEESYEVLYSIIYLCGY